MARAERPLSPHLQIYRWYLSMALSIAHRATGIALSAGLLLFTWWLMAMAAGEESFGVVQAVLDNAFGSLILFGYTFVLALHMCNGIRHLVFDAGYGFDRKIAHQSGIAVIGAAIGLTLVTWIAVFIAA